MLQRPSSSGFLALLQMPLRDAMRGVATFAEVTEEALEPAAEYLPGPVRSSVRAALNALGDTRARMMDSGISHEDICQSADVLVGRMSERAAFETFGSVTAFAWDRLWPAVTDRHVMISEVLLVSRLSARSLQPGETPGQRAAALLCDLRRSSAIGRLPGMPTDLGEAAQQDVDLTLAAILVWLLAARADTLEAEQTLLELSLALIRATQADVLASIDDPERLARQLQTLAAHL